MKQGKLVSAYKVISDLYQQRLPLPISYKLYKLKATLQKAWDFQVDEERKLVDEFKPTVLEDGRLQFADPDSAQSFDSHVRDVLDMDSDIEVTPVILPVIDGLSITPSAIENLEGIVTFTEGA